MTAKKSVRAATGTAKESVRHAAEVVKPHAGQAKDTAARYAHEAGARLGPKVSKAAEQARHSAREGYEHYVGPRVAQALDALPPEVDRTAGPRGRAHQGGGPPGGRLCGSAPGDGDDRGPRGRRSGP